VYHEGEARALQKRAHYADVAEVAEKANPNPKPNPNPNPNNHPHPHPNPNPNPNPNSHPHPNQVAEKAGEICLDWRSEARGKCEEMASAYEAWQAETPNPNPRLVTQTRAQPA